MPSDDVPPAASRRQFLKLLAIAGVTTVGGAASAPRAQAPPSPTAASTPADSTASPADPPLSDDAQALAEIVHRRYGPHLSAAQLDAVAREIDQRLQSGTRLRAVRLANSDEPSVIFHASVAR